jgi:hypothetical protein
MINETFSHPNSSEIKSAIVSIQFIFFSLFTFFSTVLNIIAVIGIVKCHKEIYAIEVASFIVIWCSSTIGNILWIFDVCLRSIPSFNLVPSLKFICYLTYSRQFFWELRSHSFAVLAFSRLNVIKTSILSNRQLKSNSTGISRYKCSIFFYLVYSFLLCFTFFPFFIIPNFLQITNYRKCSRTWNHYFKIAFMISRSFISPFISFFIYVIIIPTIIIIGQIKNKTRLINNRLRPKLILTVKMFVYSLFDMISMITFLLNLFFSKYEITFDNTDQNELVYKYLIDIILGYCVEHPFIHTLWFNLFIWFYQVCYSFHILILIYLHNILFISIKNFLY